MRFEDENIANLILSLKSLNGVGNRTISKLLLEKKKSLEATSSFTENFIRSLDIKAINRGLDKADLSWETIQRGASKTLEFVFNNEIQVLHPYMDEYPRRLLTNRNFPPILFCKGDVTLLNMEKIVAIIGTRVPTNFGSRMGFRLSRILVENDYVILSGLALGSDTIGHCGALDAHGKTIAVLPTSLDSPVYPKQNQELAQAIVEKGGLLISEYVPGKVIFDKELIGNLVARDEWQAGMSDGVICIETSITGGSNHAIRHAITMGKPVAVFDYSSRIHDEFLNEDKYSGNVNYLKSNQANGLFSLESIDNFINSMIIHYSNSSFIDLKYRPQNIENEDTTILKQQKLF